MSRLIEIALGKEKKKEDKDSPVLVHLGNCVIALLAQTKERSNFR